MSAFSVVRSFPAGPVSHLAPLVAAGGAAGCVAAGRVAARPPQPLTTAASTSAAGASRAARDLSRCGMAQLTVSVKVWVSEP